VARPVAQFAAVGAVAVVVVALVTAAASRRVGTREAINDAREATLATAQAVVEPVLTDGLVTGDAASVAAVADVVERKVLSRSVVRVKVWTAGGTIVYSDDARLQDKVFSLETEERDALRTGRVAADVSDLTKPENRDERAFGKLLEVYAPMRTPSGRPLLFEAYYRYAAVSQSGGRVWRSFAPVAIGALVVLELVQIPLAWSLAARLRQRQREREALLQRAADASDIERRRIATDLHDGVVQELAGVAFNLAAAARIGGGDDNEGDARYALAAGADSVRAAITDLRSTLVDIYPPDLAGSGLRDAIAELAADTTDARVDVSDLPDSLPAPVASLLYRAAREAMRNTVQHAGASTVTVSAGANGTRAWIDVVDDGCGFDASSLEERAAEGHLGLKGLRGLVHDAGGQFDLTSADGAGTRVHVEVPVA
jgi:signal transduction histidine kinase